MRVYLPPDANCLLSVMDHCLRSRHYVNVVIAGKHPAPQWLTMDAAVKHCTEGIGIWQWASNDQDAAPDVVMACCGDVPTLETLAAVSILREHLPDLKIRVVNVVDLMKLQPQTEHPHGLSDMDFDELFTRDKPVIFAFHGYPWLIHRLTYRRANHDNIHVRGYKEEGTITTPFDMTVLNDLDRFHLVMDAIDRLPQTGDKGIYLKQQLKDKLIEHKQYIDKNGEDLPEIRNWKWARPPVNAPAASDKTLPRSPLCCATTPLTEYCESSGAFQKLSAFITSQRSVRRLPLRQSATKGIEPRISRISRIKNSPSAPPSENNFHRSKRRQRRRILPSFPSFPSVQKKSVPSVPSVVKIFAKRSDSDGSKSKAVWRSTCSAVNSFPATVTARQKSRLTMKD